MAPVGVVTSNHAQVSLLEHKWLWQEIHCHRQVVPPQSFMFWRSVSESRFQDEVERWSSDARSAAGTFVGPLLSWNSLTFYVDQWKSIAEAFEHVKMRISNPLQRSLFLWTWNDAKGNKCDLVSVNSKKTKAYDNLGNLWDLSGVLCEGGEVERLKEMAQMVWGEQTISKDSGDKWKSAITLSDVQSQCRWQNDGIEWRELWEGTSMSFIPRRVMLVDGPVAYEYCCQIQTRLLRVVWRFGGFWSFSLRMLTPPNCGQHDAS